MPESQAALMFWPIAWMYRPYAVRFRMKCIAIAIASTKMKRIGTMPNLKLTKRSSPAGGLICRPRKKTIDRVLTMKLEAMVAIIGGMSMMRMRPKLNAPIRAPTARPAIRPMAMLPSDSFMIFIATEPAIDSVQGTERSMFPGAGGDDQHLAYADQDEEGREGDGRRERPDRVAGNHRDDHVDEHGADIGPHPFFGAESLHGAGERVSFKHSVPSRDS